MLYVKAELAVAQAELLSCYLLMCMTMQSIFETETMNYPTQISFVHDFTNI